jgi:cytochrome c-type biogenesis protein CcmH/NrfG
MIASMSGHDDRWAAAEEAAELLAEGDHAAAAAEAERVLAADPDNEYAWYFLGAARFEQGQLPKALRAYVEALRRAPAYVGAMLGAGHTLRLLGRHDEAIRMGKQVLLRAPEDGDALHLLGLVHFARGDTAAARDYLERFLATRPELEVAHEVQGLVQALRGEVVPLQDDDGPGGRPPRGLR